MRTFMTAALGICLVAGMAFTAEASETKAKMEKAKGEMKADTEEMKGEMKGAKEEMKGNDTKASMERAKGNMKGAGERTKGKMKEMKEKMNDQLGRHPPRRGTARRGGRFPQPDVYSKAFQAATNRTAIGKTISSFRR
jgi:hypothetical protein